MEDGFTKLASPYGKELLMFSMEETLVIFLKAGNGREVMRKSEMKVCMEEFKLLVIPMVHGMEVKFGGTKEVLNGVKVRVKGSHPNGLGEKFGYCRL
jgi:hypothetical protein